MKQYQSSQFLEAAKLLANGNDPERLAEALASWARLVGFPHRADDDQDDRDMLLAARILDQDEFGRLISKFSNPKSNPCEIEINDRMREF